MNFPYTRQPDAMDCGPACLKMVTEYYGRHYSLDTLREETFIGREGVTLLGISRAAEKIGMRTVGGKLSYEDLKEKAPLPCIVHWNQNHFVVVYKILGKNVFVADPGKGLITYTREAFCDHWISTSTKGEDKGVEVYDMNGRLVAQQPVTETETVLDATDWAAGTYIWKVVSDKAEIETGKWVKE